MTGRPAAAAPIWRSVEPAAIETALAELWLEAAQDGPLSRAVMSNLIVVRPDAPVKPHAQEEPGSDIVRIAQQHPARTILLNYAPDAARASGPARASLGVLVFGAGHARYGVEIIAVDAACADQSIPSIVRRLARGDVPTTIWWAADLSRIAPSAAMFSTGRQIVYDSAMWRDMPAGARAAAFMARHPRRLDLADLNWRRFAPLRSAVVHALGSDPRPLAAADVDIRYRPGEAAAAWLLAAWFRCRLNWRASQLPSVEESREGDDLVTLTLWRGARQLSAAMNRQRVTVKAADTPVFRMPVPRETMVDQVVAELRSLGHDTCLTDTVASLAGMLDERPDHRASGAK